MFRGVKRGGTSDSSKSASRSYSGSYSGYSRSSSRSSSKKAQVAMEYLVIVGFVLVITIPLVLIFYDYSGDSTIQINQNQVNAMGKKIIDAAESVYYLGTPSKITLKVNFPEMIDSVSIASNELVFTMKGSSGVSEILVMSSVPIHGSLSNFKGLHNIQIEARADGVWITE